MKTLRLTSEEIHQGDVGTRFTATLVDSGDVVPLGLATNVEYRVQPPGNVALRTWTAFVFGDPANGQIRYIAQAGDLDLTGWWTLQAYVRMSTGDQWHSAKARFRVYPNV